MHLRIVSNFIIKFILLGLPATGIIWSNGLTWNIVWWVIYFVWGGFWAKHEIVTKTCIGTMWVQIPFVIIIDLDLRNAIVWPVAAIWAGLVYWHIYNQAVLMNRATDQVIADEG